MKRFEFNQAKFEISSNGKMSMPKQNFPHVVLAGRSNVGKSSFINHFFQKKELARTSSKPGKTGLLNFFTVDESLFFVDIPGYGYAQRSKCDREGFKEMIDIYLKTHLNRMTFLHFIDGRHPPLENDWEFIHWIAGKGKKVLFIITKMDKLKPKERKPVMASMSEALGPFGQIVFYNIEEKSVRTEVKEKLGELLSNG